MTHTDTTGWPPGLITLADWELMGEDELHQVECSEGVLVVTPKPSPRHQWAMTEIVHALNAALPQDTVAVADVDVLLTAVPLTLRAPDVVVVSRARLLENPPRFMAEDILLAIEIGSPGTRRIDRVTKLSEYAEAGIADYWIVDLAQTVSLLALRLGGDGAEGAYAVVGEHTGQLEVTVAGVIASIDLDTL